ncbi:hypothetical protein UFOVP157_9 [uncultured Caudovirales phage]|uniref:Uncharacterized protein n=1 Tax=uncultured Caudovirales phage TaxID=2100421 RepID=A0A6J7WEF1_9CAUD|nr:hypothetical protein UFOVP157_9 [uncultured Caudovirales phage]
MKYRITYLAGKLDTTYCPPLILSALFPDAQIVRTELSESECIVEFATAQIPVDLSPLIKVEPVLSI